jgi:hypothetical protein
VLPDDFGFGISLQALGASLRNTPGLRWQELAEGENRVKDLNFRGGSSESPDRLALAHNAPDPVLIDGITGACRLELQPHS